MGRGIAVTGVAGRGWVAPQQEEQTAAVGVKGIKGATSMSQQRERERGQKSGC